MRKTIPRAFNPSSPNEMKNVINELQSAMAEKVSLLNSMSENLLALQVQLEITQGQSIRLIADNSLLKDRVKDLEKEHTTRYTEMATLSQLLLKYEEQNKKIDIQLQQANLELEANKKETLNIRTALNSTNNKLKNSESEYNKLKSQLVREQEKNRTLTSKANELQDNLNARFNELAKLTNMLEASERKLLTKDIELSNYKNQLDKIKHSFSWKAAAPARAISKKLKKNNPNSSLVKHIKTIESSGLFNVDWYQNNCPELDELPINPIEHYLIIGFKVGLNPSEQFNGNDYLSRYPDVQQEGVNPLLHYLMFGKNEGRTI